MTPDQKHINNLKQWRAGGNSVGQLDVDSLLSYLTAAKKREQDLVEAGKWVLNVISGVGRSGGPIDPMDDEPEAAFDSLKRLIEQAEGGGE